MTAGHGTGFFDNPSNWVLIATVAFAFIVIRFGRGKILGLLDGRTASIRAELDEAVRLRKEAQDLLDEFQRKQRDALKTADEIISHARESARRLREEAQADLEESLRRKEAQLLDKIARAEAAAIEDIRNQAADLAVAAARRMVTEALKGDGAALMDQTIENLPTKLN